MMGPLGAMQENNPLVQALGKLQQNTLGGGGVTLGNQQAQQDYAQQMADALARMRSADSQQGMAESLMSPDYVPNSGLLGSIAMMAQAAAGKKMAGRASKEDAAAREAYYKGQAGQEGEKARREAEKDAAERERRQGVAGQMGLSAREVLEFAETGKVPQAVRNVPMMTDQGLVNVNPYSGEYAPVQPQGQSNVRIDPALANNPEAMAAIQRDMASGATGDASYQVPQGQRPLMPYRDPAEAQRQAASDARANAQLGLAYRAAERADKALEVQQQAARNKPVTEDQSKSAGYALRMERALESIDKSAKTNPGADRPGFGIAAIDALPESIGNYLKPAERQNIEAAQLDALDAALTLNTGAAYTKEQLFGLRKAYFPQPGDDESTIDAKKERLGGLIDTARIRARQAYPGQGTGSPAPSAPASSGAGVDDLLKKYGIK